MITEGSRSCPSEGPSFPKIIRMLAPIIGSSIDALIKLYSQNKPIFDF